MKRGIYKKTIIFVCLFFVFLVTASVILTYIVISRTEDKIVSETAGYLKTGLIQFETADYSFSADIIKTLNNNPEIISYKKKDAEDILQSYHLENGENFSKWLYEKNIKMFFEAAVENSMFLISADLLNISDDKTVSLLNKNNNSELSSGRIAELVEKKVINNRRKSNYTYLEKISSYRFSSSSDSNSSGRALKLVFDFSQIFIKSVKRTAFFIALIIAALISFFIYILPDIKYYYEGRLDNIKNSLNEIIKGNREVRIYLPGEDVLTDISSLMNRILDESVKKESELYLEKDKFNLFFENIPIGAVVLDSEGRLVFENRFVQKLFNDDYEAFPGVFYSVLNRSDSDMLFENLSYILSGEKTEYRHRCRLFGGSCRHQFFEIRINSILEEDGLKFVVITFTDLSSGPSRGNTGIDFFNIDGKSKLAGTIANGLNNIHHIINGYTEYLLLGGFNEEEFRDVIKNMIDASRRASVLTRHLKIFSRENHMSDPVRINVKNMLNDLDTILKEVFHSGITFSLTDDGSDPECLGDEIQLEQVVIDLCINANDAVEGKGAVEISAGSAEYSEKDVQAYPEAVAGKYIYIRIKDTGSGIPDDQIRKIFEPFYSTHKNDAPGMGLSLSYSIVMNHKGFIHVESAPGKGSIFTVNIPAARTEETDITVHPSKSASSEKDKKGRTILFVDDEELILSLGKIMLEKAGYNVLTASGGKEAFNLAENYKPEIHLLICDLVMPDISGIETVEMIRKIKPDIPVLYISGFAEKELDPAGDHEILGKPFKSTELISRISDMLE